MTANGVQYPRCRSGIEELLDQLFEAYHLDAQDLAWTSIDSFFSFKQDHSMDFQEYLHEWETHLEEAERYGGLTLFRTSEMLAILVTYIVSRPCHCGP